MTMKFKIVTVASALVFLTSATGATNPPPSPALKSLAANTTSEMLQQPLIASAKEVGIYSDISYWGVKDGHLEVGLTQVKDGDAKKLEASLNIPVVVVKAQKFVTAEKFVPKSTSMTAPASAMSATGTIVPPLTDRVPFQGGDRIWTSVTGGWVICTAGGTYVLGGAKVMMTAGHCGVSGQGFQQGYIGNGISYKTGFMGWVGSIQWGDGRIDAETLTGGSIQGRVWVSSSLSLPVSGAMAIGMGTPVCFDGSFTGYICDAKVTATNICIIYQAHNGMPQTNVCGVSIATSNSGQKVVQEGDSGGPVLTISGSSAKLGGVISGMSTGGTQGVFNSTSAIQNVFGAVPATQ